MIRAALVAALLLAAVPASADQFDAIVRFNTLAQAKADPDVRKFYNAIDDLFAGDSVLRVQVWRASQDTTDKDGNVTHDYLPGVFYLISLPRLVQALKDNAAVLVVLNRDFCNARKAGCVVRSTVAVGALQDTRISPVFAGMDIPWGNIP